jgi:hypothetical protein
MTQAIFDLEEWVAIQISDLDEKELDKLDWETRSDADCNIITPTNDF